MQPLLATYQWIPGSSARHRNFARIGSVAFHALLLGWLLMPKAPIEIPQQQIVEISVVALSEPAPQVAEAPAPKAAPTPPLPKAEVAELKSAPRESVAKPEQKQVSAPTPPTTGKQSPDATLKTAAVGDAKPDALNNAPPVYPEQARAEGDEGKVLLDVAVSPSGTAREVSVKRSSGNRLLDIAAIKAVSAWRFIPAKRGDEIVEARITVPVEFRLE